MLAGSRPRAAARIAFSLLLAATVCAQDAAAPDPARQDTLRGSISPERAWWDLLHYDLAVQVFPAEKRLQGTNTITFKTRQAGERMQIDLQPPLAITRVVHGEQELTFEREGNVYWIAFKAQLAAGVEDQITISYGGKPRESQRPPWSGGLSWTKDDQGRDFIATTCQGIGASIWWPNKDHGCDEPDRGMDMHITVPAPLVAVSNGRLIDKAHDDAAQTNTFHWRVTNPINNYGVNMNIGHYVSMDDTFAGEGGKLDLQYWVLDDQVEQARKHFAEAPRTLAAFEHWFGKYPFYEDGYKLVVVPYLGMEHQSSVTYGNGFKNGYLGRDLSATGVGLKFDFIIVHESAHEWWGNNISMQDAADMWIHESFANYAEGLFVEFHFTQKEAQDYVIGTRKLIRNDRPIIGTYGRNKEGSGDMYPKGGNLLHTMRHVLNDDARWRACLRGLGQQFWHQTVKTADFEAYMSKACGFDFGKVFDQYLRTTQIPLLHHEVDGNGVKVWLTDVVPGFQVPVLLHIDGKDQRVTVGEEPVRIALDQKPESIELDRNFYMRTAAQ